MTGQPEEPLFRQEVIIARQDAWLGDVTMAQSISQRLLTLVVLVAALLLIGYAVWGQYTRKIRVFGYVVPSIGAVKVVPSQAGQVVRLLVGEGQHVHSGEVLAALSADKATASGDTAAEVKKQIEIRAGSMREEQERVGELYTAQIGAAQVRARNLRAELAQAEASIRLQEQRLALVESAVAAQRKLFAGGFISDMALRQKEQDQLAERSAYENSKKDRLTLLRDLNGAEADVLVLSAKSKSEHSELANRIASVEQEKLESESRHEFLIRAPQTGVVTALVTDVGRLVTPATVLFTLLPEEGLLQAEAYLPSRAAGFVREGTKALIQFQSYPYQKFGSHRARVVHVSRVAVPVSELSQPLPASAGSEPVYIATLALEKTYVEAYGRHEPLKVGMSFDANLALETRTLLEWLFEPVYSISGNWADQ
jgi:membrane fusion protein